jgi:hypothetical protein
MQTSGALRRGKAESCLGEINWNLRNQPSSFSDAQLRIVGAPLGASPESILTIVVMDSGLVLRTPRNDELWKNSAPPKQKPRPEGEPDGAFMSGRSSRTSACAAPGPIVQGIIIPPPERCDAYAVRPARSGRSPRCSDRV